MASKYIRSLAGGAGTGADWANAYTTATAAMAGGAAGDDFWVSEDHAETTASAVTITCPGTIATPCRILCVDHLGSVPPVAADLRTTASVATTGASDLNVRGTFEAFGITWSAGSGAVAAACRINNLAGEKQTHENCTFINLSSNSNSIFFGGGQNGAGEVTLINPKFKFGAAADVIACTLPVKIYGGSVLAGGSNLTDFFTSVTSTGTPIVVSIEGFDASGWSSTLNLVRGGANAGMGEINFHGCKLPAAWTGLLVSTPFTKPGLRVAMWNCDSGDTNYRLWIEDLTGSIKSETVIVRTDGASDGTTPYSLKMATSANADPIVNILRGQPIAIRNEVVGVEQTWGVEVVHDSVGSGAAGALTDKEGWIEIQYLGTSGFPLSLFVSDKAITTLTAAADQASSVEAWTTTGLATPLKQALTKAFTPQEKGVYIVTPCFAGVSDTVYVCPKATS